MCVCRAHAGPTSKLMSSLGCGCRLRQRVAVALLCLSFICVRRLRVCNAFFSVAVAPAAAAAPAAVCCTQNAARLRHAPQAATLPAGSRPQFDLVSALYLCRAREWESEWEVEKTSGNSFLCIIQLSIDNYRYAIRLAAPICILRHCCQLQLAYECE